jgi:hypothetical protein
MLIDQPVPVTLKAWEWVFLAAWAEGREDTTSCAEILNIFRAIRSQVKPE